MRRVYIGYDYREDEAYKVAEYSITRRSSVPVEIIPLNHRTLRKRNLFTRPWHITANGQFIDERDGRPFSTEFAHSRFLVPSLERRERDPTDFVLFMDCDVLCLGDIEEVFLLGDKDKAVQVVKFPRDMFPNESIKMDGASQFPYNRKLWSSVILWNVWHPANLELDATAVNVEPGSWLHNFRWLSESEIGDLPSEWNHIPGKSVSYKSPKLIHYTEGGPWFEEYRGCAMSEEWLAEKSSRERMRNILV